MSNPVLIFSGDGARWAEVGAAPFSGLHVRQTPLPYGAGGHFRTTHRCVLANSQAANSRIFELVNPSAALVLVITDLRVVWLQTGAHTAAIEDSLDVFKCTGFTAVDNTNVVTPVPTKKRETMAASLAAIRGVTPAGAAAGMTGGTLTKIGAPFSSLPQWLLAAEPTTASVVPAGAPAVMAPVEDGDHPFVLAQNEGFEIENRVLLGAAAASSVYIDCSWAEVPVF